MNSLLRIGWNWYILGAVRDISERIEQDATLLKSEALLREAQEVGGLGAYEFFPMKDCWESTPVLDSIFGINADHIRTAETWLDLIHPDDRLMMEKYLTVDILTNHKEFKKEYRIIRPIDKEIRWVDGHGLLKDFIDGQPTRMIGTIRDVTERRNLQNRMYQALSAVENNQNAITFTDLDNNITYVNSAFLQMYGYNSPDELIGKNISIVRPPEKVNNDLVKVNSIHPKTVEEGQGWRGDLENITKDGRKIDVHLSTAPITDQDGNMIGAVGSAMDISDKKKAEEALLQAKEAAERGDRYKTKYLSTLAHDVRTPLLIMASYAAELKSNPDMPAKRRSMMLETITRRSEYLLALNNDILKSTTIGTGVIELKENNLNLNEISIDVVMGIEAVVRAQEKPIDVQLNLDDDIPAELIGDYVKIVELLDNLGTNAVKFTNEGSIELGIRMKDKNTIDFYVTDTGCGIAEGDLEEIFEPFKQLQAGKTLGISAGVGKGLSVVKEYAEQLGGKAYVKSELGKGSTFGFTMPLRKGVIGTESIITTKEAIAIYNPKQRGDYTILYVDDEPHMVKLVSRLLEVPGYNVIGVETGEEAIEIFQKSKPGIVITDIGLGGKIQNGFKLADILRSVEQERGYEHTPIIGLGGDAKEDVFSNNPGNPLDNYLQKTQSHGLTIQMIDKYLLEQSDS